VRKGTLIDATVIGSASKGDKDAAWVRHRTRAPAHGYKAHLAAAKDSGIIRGVETTPANEADVNIAPSIIPDEPGEVYADRAYDALAVEKAIEARGGTPKLMRKGHRWLAAERREAHNRLLRPIRARIEKIFGTWKRSYRFRCMRWIGLSKARLQVHLAVIADNVKRYGACKPPERTRNADLQNHPSAKPVTTTPSHRSAGDLQSATLLKCLPNHTRRRPTKCHPAP
jgi:transposase, IS5 family